jgi:hypothetical protein
MDTQVEQQAPKKDYRPPNIEEYGDLVELTQSGAGGIYETGTAYET